MNVKQQEHKKESGIQGSILVNGSGQKNFKKKQLDILVSIENQNIERNVKDLLEQFNPPTCQNCLNRRADRVCVNKACGPSRYLHIICGKCHAESHSQATIKPEIDIEEYFTRLAKFSNEEKLQILTKKRQTIDLDQLNVALQDIQNARDQLNTLKFKIGAHVKRYESPQEEFSHMQGCITKALSLCEYNNICEQLLEIKNKVVFEKNKFMWNDASQLLLQFIKVTENLEIIERNLKNDISKSFKGGYILNLNDLVIKWKLETYSIHRPPSKEIRGENDKITISGISFQRQLYLDYELNPESIYRLRFTFLVKPQSFNVVGIMPLSVVTDHWICSQQGYSQGNPIYKQFFYNSTNDSKRIIKGIDIKDFPILGTQIEMRIDMKNVYLDFSDYPNYSNINSNPEGQVLKQEPYVIMFALGVGQSIQIDSLEIIDQIEDR